MNKKSFYFDMLFSDLLPPLFFYFTAAELSNILLEVELVPGFSRLLNSKIFWRYIWKRDISSFLPMPENAYEQYKEILNKVSKILVKYEKINYLAENGYDILLSPLLNNVEDYNWAIKNAATGGQIEIVELMLEKGANDYNQTLACAAFGGHIGIVRLMLEKGANNYNLAMAYAAEKGYIKIIRLMLEKGANNYNSTMSDAARGGHIEIVRLMLENGANDYNWAMTWAAQGGQ